jgi:hypothetical protein
VKCDGATSSIKTRFRIDKPSLTLKICTVPSTHLSYCPYQPQLRHIATRNTKLLFLRTPRSFKWEKSPIFESRTPSNPLAHHVPHSSPPQFPTHLPPHHPHPLPYRPPKSIITNTRVDRTISDAPVGALPIFRPTSGENIAGQGARWGAECIGRRGQGGGRKGAE